MTCSLEAGTCSARLSFTFRPLSSVLAGMITSAPLSARTLAVSFPIPFVAPVFVLTNETEGRRKCEKLVMPTAYQPEDYCLESRIHTNAKVK
jgi:hypothetical protein